jgi:hypothetical protein
LTSEEFKAMYLNYNVENKPAFEVASFEGVAAPESVDWRKEGAVSAVKD